MSETTIVDASRRGPWINFSELYKYRELLWMFAKRDLKIKYAQTFLGVFWTLLKPLMTLFIFTLLFGSGMWETVKINSATGDGVPYPLYVLAGMIGWNYFNAVLSLTGMSLIYSSSIIGKIYFPRIIIPFSNILVGLVDFGVTILFMAVMMIIYQIPVYYTLLFLPLFVIITIVISTGLGLWVSAFTVRYRDLQSVLPFLLQMFFYLTPVIYPMQLIPGKYLWLYKLNPMVSIIDGYRFCFFNGTPPDLYSYISYALVFVLFFTGVWYFQKIQKTVVDII